uniref:Uncharacterized protein n=1 Tax=Anopheles dirus TaxID=7168 RepID=A0A182N9E2_9DIPT
EAYRRWGCSVFIPYFASRDDIKSVNNKTGNRDSDRATQGKSNAIFGDAANKQTEPNMNDANKQQLVKNISITVKSSRRKTQRVRIRPCLNVCQTVEQKCPYMLPGDRAPAYPTQYAGEPTFLCRDLNIEETGEQLRKSNNGPTGCCYDYCGSSPIDGLCSRCDPLHNETTHRDSASLEFNSEPPDISPSCPSITSPTSSSSQSEQCRLSQAVITSTATTSYPSTTTTATTTSRVSRTTTTASSITIGGSRWLTSTTAMSVPSGSSPVRAISSLLRALCALGSVYRTHTNGVQAWVAMVAMLTVGTELVTWTKQLVHLLVVL